jgi:AAA family ATPase
MGELRFVVRPLTTTGLDGAFRVQIAPEALDKIGLKVEDICQITDEDGATGLGIAWRAADRMGTSPKIPPAKMSDTLRETFGFKQGTQITISKSDKRKTKAVAVSLTDVTPADYDGIDDDLWLGRCRFILGKSRFAFTIPFEQNTDSRFKAIAKPSPWA